MKINIIESLELFINSINKFDRTGDAHMRDATIKSVKEFIDTRVPRNMKRWADNCVKSRRILNNRT